MGKVDESVGAALGLTTKERDANGSLFKKKKTRIFSRARADVKRFRRTRL